MVLLEQLDSQLSPISFILKNLITCIVTYSVNQSFISLLFSYLTRDLLRHSAPGTI